MYSPCVSTYRPLRLLLSILLIHCVVALFGQPFGNEWINYDQQYYKFPIAEEGVYRINYNALASAGVPLASIDPRTIQVYTRQAEVPVYIRGEEDGSFGLNDFIELHATGNDGWLDAMVYDDPSSQTNPYHSLYNDTIHYYITWEEGNLSNLRYEQVSEQNLDGLVATPYVWRKSVVSLTSNYFQGKLDSWGSSTSYYTAGEGWFGPRIGFPSGNLEANISVPSANVYANSGAPQATIRAIAASNSDANVSLGQPNHHLQIGYGTGSNQTIVYDQTFSGYVVIDETFQVSPGQLSTSTNVLFRVVDDLGLSASNLSDYCAVSNVTLEYPMIPNLSGQSQWKVGIPSDGSGNMQLFEFEASGENPILFARGAQPQRIIPQQSGGLWRAGVIQSGTNPIQALVIDESEVQTIAEIEPVGAAGSGDFTNFETFNVDSAYIIVTHKSLKAEADAYANHRNLRFNTVVIDVAELYDQFGGGIEKCGIAIRRFVDMLLASWDTEPQYLFLLGKSIREAPDNGQPGSRNDPNFYMRNLVPSFGYPSSDNLITVGLQGSDGLDPTVRTGRLAAETPDQVQDYLDKVITFESQPPAEWMKNIMHFGGGTTPAEQNQFQGYLINYDSIISDTCFGGLVHSFYKDNDDPISINLSSEIDDLIEEGVTLMTFFGHAGGSGFDQNIDNPENFEWNGKYPFLIGNACYTGDIHSPSSSSTSEEFLLLPQKGVIGFLSTVKLGFPGTLNTYSSEFYRQLAYKNYGQTVGDQIKETIEVVGDVGNLLMVNQVLGMTLHGDPAIILNSFPKPDYQIEANSVFFEPSEVSTIQDSLTVHIALKNIGKATNFPFDVVVERDFPDNGADSVYVIHVDQLYNSDTLSLTLPVQPARALGENLFSVQIDLPVNDVQELDDIGNNSLSDVPLLITNGGIIPVYPYKYAVVAQPEITLKASTGNPFANLTNYRFQVDTTRYFNSPFLDEMIVNQAGGLVEWELPFNLTDSTVYFWRVAVDTLPEALKWRESSFQYIEGETGWGQAHFQQFNENFYNQLVYNETQQEIDFFSGTVNLRCNVIGGSTSLDQEVGLNLEIIEYGGCGSPPSVHVAVIDPLTFEFWGTAWEGQNPENDFGNGNNGSGCRNRVERFFIFGQSDPAQMAGFENMILNEVPEGHYLLVYSWRYLVQQSLEPSPFYTTMSSIGATVNAAMPDSIPYIGLFRKGQPEPIAELFGESTFSTLELNQDLEASGNNGAMMSVPAGPVQEWGSFHYRFHPQESASADSTGVRLIGRQWNNAEIDLSGTQHSGLALDQPNLNTLVDATQFPFIRIRSRLKDEVTETPAQLRRWHLLYDEVPEAVVNPAEWFQFESAEVDQGEEVLVSYAVTNASTQDMDSLLVRYWVINEQNSIQEIDMRRIAPLAAGESIIDSITFDTWGLGGNNQFWLEVNATNPETGQYDQIEQYHFNNFLQLAFDVSKDNENPLLDVTFDGLHILDGEIVSTQPEINISLTDENLFLLMDEDADTSNFEIFFSAPGGEFERHYFYNGSTQNMIWIPASGSNNKFQILYRPEFTQDGMHTMLVRATDRSGNSSGDSDYRVNFEVITASTITDVLNYPNPFSTKTHFVFTLTGSQVPDYMKIQIMTISGKIVKEITKMELGPLRVGRNITDYYWDGTDMYGDRLANGIYLYRVIAKINGESIEKRETAAGKYFKQEFGKMYLMR